MSARPTDPITGTAPRTVAVVWRDWPVIAAGFAPDDPTPVVVLHANRVVAGNAAARAAGVRVGLRRREAQGRCPEARVIAHDPARDARCFEPVVAALATLTPWVEVDEPGVCACAARGPSRYFGGDEALAALVLRTVVPATSGPSASTTARDRSADHGHPPAEVRVGVADGPLVARLAAARAPAEGTLVIPPGTSAAFLAPVPLRVLGPHVPDPEILTTWLQLGLSTLGEVAALPSGSVLGRFGPDGAWVHRLARGLDPRGLRPEPVPPDVAETVDLDPPAERSDAVAFAARTAADALVARLAARGLSCGQVIVTLHTDHGEHHERRWRLDGPARPAGGTRPLAAAIADRTRWQVDGWLSAPLRDRPTAGITRLVLAPGTVEPARGFQAGFWGGGAGADERVVRAVARLESLAGPESVCVADARGGRHPGTEITLVPTAAVDLTVPRSVPLPGIDTDDPSEVPTAPPAVARRAGAPSEAPPWPGRLPAPSPTLLVDPPRPVEVDDAAGQPVEVDGRGELRGTPATLRSVPDRPGAALDRPMRIVAWAGPWPVDERWWDPAERRRQARMQVVTEHGDALLLARHDRRWWLTAVHA